MRVIDLLKIFAVVAVIMIHIISAYQTAQFVALDQVFRFSVPMFVALSGFGLMLGYNKKSFNLLNYFVRRVGKLIPWYLFWATIIILAVTFIWHEDQALYHGAKLWRLYILGQADYHLYFVPMIIQLYLLFPLLLFLFRRFPPWFLVILTFLWQVGWYLLISQKTEVIANNNVIWPDQEQYRNFATWIFYFVLGMFLATKVDDRSKKYLIIGIIGTISGLILCITNSQDTVARGMDVLVATRFTRIPVLLYATGTIILGKYLISNFKFSFPVRLAGVSYIVYLLHPLVLRVFFHLPAVAAATGLIGASLIVIPISFLIALLTAKIKLR